MRQAEKLGALRVIASLIMAEKWRVKICKYSRTHPPSLFELWRDRLLVPHCLSGIAVGDDGSSGFTCYTCHSPPAICHSSSCTNRDSLLLDQ